MNSALSNGLVIFVLLTGIAWYAQSILLPVIFAFLLWVIITSWGELFRRVSIRGWSLPPIVSRILSGILFVAIVAVLGNLLAADLEKFGKSYVTLEKNLRSLSAELEVTTGFDAADFVFDTIETADVPTIAKDAAGIITTFSVTAFTIILYVLFIFAEQKQFETKLQSAAGRKYKSQRELLDDIMSCIREYIGVKTAISLLTAILCYGVMVAVQLQFAFVFAFIIFVMNFIPSIGSIIATIFPVLFALVLFPTMWPALALLIILGTIQLVVGNVIEPKFLGSRLNVSSLLLFFSLFFWGALWGLPGMFLSVPLTVIIMIILSRIPQTRAIGIWMSGDGEV